MGQSGMKECHSCGATQEEREKLQELDNEYYCSFCLDKDGKPRNHNPVRDSITRFWRERDSDIQESTKNRI